MFKRYSHPRFFALCLFGFLSALPIPLTGSVLTTWLAELGIAKALIGLLALFEAPFALKPLLWPLINRTKIPFFTKFLGRRKAWAFVSLLGSALFLALSALISPVPNLLLFYLLIALTSLFSGAVYLIGIAYEIESLPPAKYGHGSACVICGYRLGLVTAGAGTLFLAHFFSWPLAYICICSTIVFGTLLLLLTEEPKYTQEPPQIAEDLRHAPLLQKVKILLWEDVLMPCLDLFRRPEWQWILVFLLFFRTEEYLVDKMINPFYCDIGFSKAEIGSLSKINGMVATVAGAFVGGSLVSFVGLERGLIISSLIHAFRFLFCIVLAWTGPNIVWLMSTELFQHFSGGMMMTAFIAALWKLTTPGKAAPQYAVLWSALSVKAKLIAFLGGLLAHFISWELFFFIAFILALVSSLLPAFISILKTQELVQER
jgi:MFS transporter, PAT family, beta-lactamase induction signal transducer AmpG